MNDKHIKIANLKEKKPSDPKQHFELPVDDAKSKIIVRILKVLAWLGAVLFACMIFMLLLMGYRYLEKVDKERATSSQPLSQYVVPQQSGGMPL